MTRRRLTPDELDLWRQVTERTERISGGGPRPERPKPGPAKPPRHAGTVALPPALSATKPPQGHDLDRPIGDRLRAAPVAMDRRAFARMRRGKLKPEAKLDLHGMTLDRAHPALSRFILSSQARGKRLVLVVTGKGKNRDEGGPIPVRHGVLRHQVPQWLAMPPLAQAVLQVSEAHVSHGGGGAYYVYLRRRR